MSTSKLSSHAIVPPTSLGSIGRVLDQHSAPGGSVR